jgi:hypothetical protein
MSAHAMASPFLALTGDLDAYFQARSSSGDLENYVGLSDLLRHHFPGAQDAVRVLTDAAEYVNNEQFLRGNSHVHVHGFTKLALYRSKERGFSVRLHIWWSGPDASDESPHEHRWSFCSMLLSGALRIRNFSKVASSENAGEKAKAERWFAYRYWDASADGVKRVDPVGVRDLSRGSEYVLQSGASHVLHYAEPHQVIGMTGPIAATLVITDAAQREYSYVYHAREQTAAEFSFGATRLSPKEVASMLQRYCAALKLN